MVTLSQLIARINIDKEQLLAWNKTFNINTEKNEKGESVYTMDQVYQIIRIDHLIHDRKFTIAGAKLELHKDSFDTKRSETIKRLMGIKQLLVELKQKK
ncbi:MAG: MerR family transcriptional regulator [Saprospiraceae bacterium]|nr:MerR family transcriptional regulator [Saprospiraceae bacterium]